MAEQPQELSFHDKFVRIQQEYEAKKSEFNEFGSYHYRNIEKMLSPLKPLLQQYNLSIIFDDEIVLVGKRYYIKANVYITDGQTVNKASAYAREELEKKKSDASQLTGSASTYARKYALQGLLAVDDGSNDPDATDNDRKNYTVTKKAAPARNRTLSAKQLEWLLNEAKIVTGLEEKQDLIDWLARPEVLGVDPTRLPGFKTVDAVNVVRGIHNQKPTLPPIDPSLLDAIEAEVDSAQDINLDDIPF